jgi:hypothetical protein
MIPRDWPISHVGSSRSFWASILIFVALLLSSQLALAQFTQQGPKLVGNDAAAPALQGNSVALSADGNSAIVGGPADNSNAGAAWVYTRSNGVWTQQGGKLVGTGAVGNAQQGVSVALSADGNTAIVGGHTDSANSGAAWVYTRSNGVWTQQGGKLVANDAVGTQVYQGWSVALSADGNTAIVGGWSDNSNTGAVWVYTRSSGVWTQQGSKLVGTGAVVGPYGVGQGYSVVLSADGNTVIVGGIFDNSQAGAAWVFTRSNEVWTQQGDKLVGAGAVGPAFQGYSTALSADGNTAVIGGRADNSYTGAAWVYTRSNGVWTQQGSKLVGTGAVNPAYQGNCVSLSGDGNTAIVGGFHDNPDPNTDLGVGAAWVYTRSNGVWTQQGSKLVGTGAIGEAIQGWSVALSADGTTALVGGRVDNSQTGAAWVFSSLPVLQVSPTTNMVAAGNQGGPFTPSSFQYQLSASASSINFTISGVPTWLTASSTSGTASAGTTVTFTVNGNANSLTPGTYGPTTIIFTNSDTGQNTTSVTATLTVNPPALQVTPTTNIAASGTQGGPFTPLSFSYTLSVPSGSVNYSITNVPPWLTPSSTSGTASSPGTTVTFTVNASANSLSPNNYVSSINFNNTTNGQGNTTRVATLTVNAPPALQVAPTGNIVAAGNEGALAPSSFQYQLSATSGSVNYSISGVPSWLSPSSTSGNVSSPGTVVTFTVNANANSLAPGTYGPTTITFTNTGTGQGTQTRTATLTVNPPALQVTPATGKTASGTHGGPFSPSSFTYALSATFGSVSYSITTPSWLTASSASGTVTTTAKTITFTVNSSARNLGPSTYTGNIDFNNTTNNQGNTTRAATLVVNPKQYKLSVSASPTGDGTVSGGGPFAEGSSHTVTATPNGSHSFVNWTQNAKVVSTSASYTFAMPSTSTTLTAHFK